MNTRLPEPESRMSQLQADLDDILDEFNLAEVAYEHEQERLVKYLTDALAPQHFKDRVATELSLGQNRRYKDKVFDFCRWVTDSLTSIMRWEQRHHVPAQGSGGRGSGGRGGRGGSQGRGGAGGNPAPTHQGGVATSTGSSTQQGNGGGRGGRGGGQNDRGTVTSAAAAMSACLKCGSTNHQVRACGNLQHPGEADELLRAWHARRRVERTAAQGSVNARRVVSEGGELDRGTVAAVVDGVAVTALLLDSGADTSLVAKGVVDHLLKSSTGVHIDSIPPKQLAPVGGAMVMVNRVATLREDVLTTSAGPLMLRNLACFVEESNPQMEEIVGRPIMKILGFSTDDMLVRARDAQQEWELGGLGQDGPTPMEDGTVLARVCGQQALPIENDASVADDDVDRYETRMASPTMKKMAPADVTAMLKIRFDTAAEKGLRPGPADKLAQILRDRIDTFRLEFGQDPPIKVAPLLVRLKSNATPTRADARRMSPADRDFLDRHVASLLNAGLVYRNPRSRWASVPRIVRKKEQDTDPTADPRMTIDERGVNDRTEPMPWPMPILEVVISDLDGATAFFVLDWFRGYWQLPLHPDCQEFFTFVTHRGMYTPTRVPMGATDSVAFCQQVVEEIFGDLIGRGILCWLDDILGYAKTQEDLMELLDQVLLRCEEYGLKLHAKKCQFFATEVKWCGRVISATGISHCPDRIQGLVDMRSPRTAGELQRFLCAVNWMRQSIPEYSKLTAGLYRTLEEAMRAAGSRKKTKLSKFLLSDASWTDQDEADLAAVRNALLRMVPLTHPSPDAELCLYTDASRDSWGAALTQSETRELKLPLEEQQHPPLAFLRGRFVGASSRWATIEKEAFAILEATRRLEYLLMRPRGFRLYTDHRNLVYIFSPHAVDRAMARYQADKLQRWAMSLMAFRYIIEHVPGESNAWGDLLSRWGTGAAVEDTPVSRAARLAVVDRVSPLLEADFVWPDETEIKDAQQRVFEDMGSWPTGVSNDQSRGLAVHGTAIWIPDVDSLQQRLCVIAHSGVSGHRGVATTLMAIAPLFWWQTMEEDVKKFVQSCLHCMTTKNGKVPRPHGETLVATRPNEVLHFDFCTMIESTNGMGYVLVLKDGMSGYVKLIACPRATSCEAYKGLLDWFKRFGVVNQWVSDQGTHFKNEVIELLRSVLGAHHHFVTACSPWANGTVEWSTGNW